MAERIRAAVFWLLMGVLALCIGAYLLFPQQVGRLLPFRCYVVLSQSMEPTIPTFSLVLVRQVSPDASLTLEPEQIITCLLYTSCMERSVFYGQLTEKGRFATIS